MAKIMPYRENLERERGAVTITFSVFIEHIKSLRKIPATQNYPAASSRDVPKLHFLQATWVFFW